ncbi:MAG: phosphatidate cytidylyltransferase [Phycisphaerae bacterium]
MLQRFRYGFIVVSALFALIVLDAFIADAVRGPWASLLGHGSIIPLCFSVLVVLGSKELLGLLRAVGLAPHAVIGTTFALLLLLSPWFCAGELFGRGPFDVEGWRWQLIWLAVMVVMTALAQLRRGVGPTAFADVGATWLMVLYLGLLPSFVMMLRCWSDLPGAEGAFWVMAFLVVTKSSDIGAYVLGTLYGRHKLVPAVSPGKSVEGAIGGILTSVTASLVLYRLYFLVTGFVSPDSDLAHGLDMMTAGYRRLSLTQAIVFGVVMSISGQLGDLFESVFKRAAVQKDSASLLPGVGGSLDLIDSAVMAAPVAWFCLTVWWDVV